MSILDLLSAHAILNIAHRGARSLAPENTLPAAVKALEVGAHMWELDVGMTRDGTLVVVHDATLERTSNVADVFPKRHPWPVHAFTLDEIRQLDFGSWFVREDPFGQIRSGSISPAELERFRGLHAPTLAEALELTKNCHWSVNVEIKDLRGTSGHKTVVEKVLSLVGAMDLHDDVLLSSFNHDYLETARRKDARIHLGVLTNRRLRDPLPLLRRLGALAYHPRMSALTRDDVRMLSHEGFHTLVWVANDTETFQRLRRLQVSGIFTDFPQDLAPMLSQAPS
jgi:glycerophosphoryl diester phosphodiesterase